MPSDFAEGCAPLRPVSAPLPEQPFCDQSPKSEGVPIFLPWMTCQHESSDQYCFTAGPVLPSNPCIIHCSVGRFFCQRKCFSHGKTLQVTLLGTRCSVQANCNCPAPVPFGSQHGLLPCSRTERRQAYGVQCSPV